MYILVAFSSLIVAANITQLPEDATVTSPSSASFVCSASGLPRPNITWTSPNSTQLTSGVGEVTIITEEVMGSEREIVSILNITSTSPSQAGEYTCLADNRVMGPGYIAAATALLTVYGTWPFCNYPVAFLLYIQ